MEALSTNAKKLDSLINSFLFDVEIYHNSHHKEEIEILQESEEDVKIAVQNAINEDLQVIHNKYSHKNEEMLDEIKWRMANNKKIDSNKKIVREALDDLLFYIEQKLSGKKEVQRKKIFLEDTIPEDIDRKLYKDNTPDDVIFDEPEEPIIIPSESVEKTKVRPRPIEIKNLEKTSAQKNEEIKKKIQDVTQKLKKQKNDTQIISSPKKSKKASPSQKPEKKTSPSQKPGKKAFQKKKKKFKKPKEIESFVLKDNTTDDWDENEKWDDVKWNDNEFAGTEEVRILDDSPKTQREKIGALVSRFLNKRPTLDWKKMDQREDYLKQRRFEKELEERKEREKLEKKKLNKKRKLNKGKKNRKNKNWNFFGRPNH